MSENRVVVKINYDSEQRRKELIDPKMVTVWHTKRILMVLSFLLIASILLGKWVLSDRLTVTDSPGAQQVQSEVPDPVNSVAPTDIRVPVIAAAESSRADSDVGKSLFAVIFDRRVVRAALGNAPANGEPGLPVDSPVNIKAGQKHELFYFSELKNLKDTTLSHHWLKNGLVVHKKSFEVKERRGKFVSSRIFTANDYGDWKVVLIDKKGKLLSEVNFYIHSQ